MPVLRRSVDLADGITDLGESPRERTRADAIPPFGLIFTYSLT